MPLAEYTITEQTDGGTRRKEYYATDVPGYEYERVDKEWDADASRWRSVGRELVRELRLSASVGDSYGEPEVYE